jgi:hypothetical protein
MVTPTLAYLTRVMDKGSWFRLPRRKSKHSKGL